MAIKFPIFWLKSHPTCHASSVPLAKRKPGRGEPVPATAPPCHPKSGHQVLGVLGMVFPTGDGTGMSPLHPTQPAAAREGCPGRSWWPR